jgi:hypothetical protein
MKLQITLHTDNPNIDTVHFTLRLKQLFWKYNVFGKFDLPDELDCENGVFRYLYFANNKPIQLYYKFSNNRLAYTQVQRLELIYEIFKLTLEE